MQWLARASPMGPDGSAHRGAAGPGRGGARPVSVRAFGAPVAPSARILMHCPGIVYGHLRAEGVWWKSTAWSPAVARMTTACTTRDPRQLGPLLSLALQGSEDAGRAAPGPLQAAQRWQQVAPRDRAPLARFDGCL